MLAPFHTLLAAANEAANAVSVAASCQPSEKEIAAAVAADDPIAAQQCSGRCCTKVCAYWKTP